jgi:glycyl-tRNA synthetase
MAKPLDFQSIFMALQHFWDEQGCLIWQPYYTQVGAGTMNPATALRVLGPEPWNVGYVEPSVRPDDGRYGENPNRMQLHYQFQVILKPDPGNPQEIYLRSLEAVGIDPNKHDIRFVEDNWEWPAFGAWGLGWEVWLDGQEITQFTYFQQAGGIPLDPVSVELTYGLDRIAIALQRVHGFRQIQWNPRIKYGQLNLQAEQEHSKYYFEIADVERLRQMYDLFESESQAALENDLVLPAYDYLLKCSHTFNVLDARGAIGVTERQAFFGRMRELASRVAQAYLDQRQRLEYPWLDESGIQAGLKAQEQSRAGMSETRGSSETYPTSAQPFLLEIGTEELPAGDLDAALGQLRTRVPELLDELRLEHGNVRITGTPRRLVVYVEELSSHQSDLERLVKGPPADRAFDAQGQPTRAAEGFARSRGVSVSELEIREMEAGRYVAAVVRESGRPAPAVLAEAIPDLIASIRFDKSMRWNSSNVAFSRPIRWLLCVYGDRIVPFEYAGLQSGKFTRGLRFCRPETITVDSPADYFKVLSSQGIILDRADRQSFITSQVDSLAQEVGGVVADDATLFGEVNNLVEAPGGLRGSFDPSYLDLPRQVLISVMKKHQRYFPVEKDGNLLPYFIAIANAPCDGDRGLREDLTLQSMDLVIEGNQDVIRARFADAAFFVNEDMKKPLEAYVPLLSTLTFQADLGSMLDKTRRIQQLMDDLTPLLGLTQQEKVEARRAAELCKADLVTKMVVEMTSLQGVMGRYYALNSGEPAAVGTAIYEHYLPRYAGDACPETRSGLAVGIADRLDTLTGLFAAGLAPTGTKDPFAQRRAALGLVGNLILWNLDFDLRIALHAAAGQLPIPASKDSQSACLVFIIERLRNTLLDEGHPYDVVDAVLAAQGYNPAGAAHAVKQLALWVQRQDWNTILPAYSRCVRITRDLEGRYPVAPQAFIEPEERQLYGALLVAEQTTRAPGSVDDFLNAFLPMIPVINRFFDEVLVMTEEATQRENRLGLLQRISALADGVADMSRLEGF